MDKQDWDMFWKEDGFTYMETNLKEYLESDTGFETTNQKICNKAKQEQRKP